MQTPRAATMIRIVVSGLLAAFILTGVTTGLLNLREGQPSQDIDCEFRTRILRDWLVSKIEHPYTLRGDETDFANLLRETQTACADRNPELKKQLDTLENIDDASNAWKQRSDAVRTELRAL